MITKSRFLTCSSGAGWGRVSVTPSTSAIASAIGSRVGRSAMSVIGCASLPADDEAVDRAVGGLLDELVAGGPAPGREVLEGPGVGGEDLDECSGRERLDRLRGLDDRHRARQPAR